MSTPTETTTSPAHEKAHPTEGMYFTIFVLLAVLTVIELTVIYVPGIKVPLLLGLSLSKAWLVVQFYMHLRYEDRILTWAFLIPVAIGGFMTIALQPLLQ